MLKKQYIPRRGDLIVFNDFNDALALIMESSYFVSHTNNQGMIKYRFMIPDTKPFQFARQLGGVRNMFAENHLMAVYNSFSSNIEVVLSLIDLKFLLQRGKWKVHLKK